MNFFNVKGISACLMFTFLLFQQISYGQSLRDLNGSEWIKPGQIYIKTKVAETGMYRVQVSALQDAGLSLDNFRGRHFQIWNLGKQIPLFVSSEEDITPTDYLEFFGEKMTVGLDSLLFSDWNSDMLNTEYSFVTDSNTYFITLDSQSQSMRYEVVQPDFENNLPPILPYYIHEDKKVFTDIFYKIQHGSLQYSNFEPVEGWAKQGERETNTSFELANYIPSNQPVTAGARISSTIFYTQLISRINGNVVDTNTFDPAKVRHLEYNIDPSQVGQTLTLNLKNNFSEDLHRLAFAYIRYSRDLICNQKSQFSFSLGNLQGDYLLPFKEFVHENTEAFIFDPAGGKKITARIKNSNEVDVILQAQPNTTYYLVNNRNGFKSPEKLIPLHAKEFTDSTTTYLIITHDGLREGADVYAAYRSSTAGGSYEVSVMEMDDIYNHFGYGVDRHFYAIKNLNKYLTKKYTHLTHVFLLGKGLSYTLIRKPEEVENHDGVRFFIPGYGIPSSDIMLFSEGNYANPAFAVGRYAALNNEEVLQYLDKVKTYEKAYENPQNQADKFWMKRVLHLSGGGLPSEQTLIKNGLLNMQSRIENSKMGAKVFTYYKTSTDQLASASLEEITALVNGGVNMITFFGHSAPGTWDFNLEDPSKYENYGKYPFINSLGCYSGNIFGEKSETVSERFVKIKDKGAIGFVASGGTAFITQLGYYGYEKYGLIADDMFGQSIGTIIKAIADKYRDSKYDTYAFYQQLILHCDPAIEIYHFDGPDYTFDFSSVKTKPELINSSVDSIYLELDIFNLGMGVKDSIKVNFYHHLQNNEVFDTVTVVLPAPYASQTYSIPFKNAGVKGIGKNTIYAKIDPYNEKLEIPEGLAKNNNDLLSETAQAFTFYILDNTALPVEPCNYSIVTDNEIVLKASTSNALIDRGNYIFQMDSTRLFNSPMLIQQKIENVQGLIEWKPTMNFTPGMVYYWRVSPDSISPDFGYEWQEASFVFAPGLPMGFNHSHYFQYTDNNRQDHINMAADRSHKFPFGEYFIDIVNGIYSKFTPGVIGYKVDFSNPAATVRPWSFMSGGGVAVVIGNPVTGKAVENWHGEHGSINTNFPPADYWKDPSYRCFGYYTKTPEDRKKIMDLLENVIPDGHYVYFFTVMNNESDDLKVGDWEGDNQFYGTSIPEILRDQGAVLIDSLTARGSFPYTFMYRKNRGATNEGLLENKNEYMSTKSFLQFQNIEGNIRIENIGPAASWDRIDYLLKNVEIYDTVHMTVYGLRDGKFVDTLFRNEKMSVTNIQQIDAKKFPYIHIDLYCKDDVNRTVPIIDHFRVFYTPLTDLAVDPKKNFRFLSKKLNRGETLSASVALTNLSDKNVDSIYVKYSVVNLEDNSETNDIRKVGPIPANGFTNLEYTQKLLGKPGKHVFIVEANHDKNFPEKHFFNNIGKQEFELVKDKFNPFLDVYFDGQKILNGDIVSSKPEIKLMLKDENSFLSLDSPDLFSIKIDTGRNQIMEIPINGTDITFSPPSQQGEPAQLTYLPTFRSGEYKLIVQAKDASGNFAGEKEQVVSFRVVEEETVSHILNYPNPFSTSTQFIFTLTGEKVPEDMVIRIYTITGKLVREITKEELGPLRIGTNRTYYKWDGTDEYGQKLANGVYLYKAFVKNQSGEDFKNNGHQKVDSAFQDGFGKMVILR